MLQTQTSMRRASAAAATVGLTAPGALLFAVSPLLDERSTRLITDLRRRGCDLIVIEVSPLEYTAPGPSTSDRLAYRLWTLQRDALRTRLRALGSAVATDAGRASALAWVGTGVAALLLAAGVAARSSAPVHAAVAVLGVLLLLRHGARLLVAPLYGAGLLPVAELRTQSNELAYAGQVGAGVISARLGAVVAVAAIGACGSAVAAIAVTVAPGRLVALTAGGAITAVAVCGAIALLARRQQRADPRADKT